MKEDKMKNAYLALLIDNGNLMTLRNQKNIWELPGVEFKENGKSELINYLKEKTTPEESISIDELVNNARVLENQVIERTEADIYVAKQKQEPVLKARNYPIELVDYRPQELNQNGINFGPAASYFIKEMKKKSF